jgi:hypothetical protein
MNFFCINGQWPPNLAKSEANYLKNLAVKLYQDANNIVWKKFRNLYHIDIFGVKKVITSYQCGWYQLPPFTKDFFLCLKKQRNIKGDNLSRFKQVYY